MLKNNSKKMNSESFVAVREKSHFRSALLNKINSDVRFRKKKKLNEGRTTNKTLINF